MKVQFKASFAKDLRSIKNKDLLNLIKDTIEQLERTQRLQDIMNIKKLKGAVITIESGSVNTELD